MLPTNILRGSQEEGTVISGALEILFPLDLKKIKSQAWRYMPLTPAVKSRGVWMDSSVSEASLVYIASTKPAQATK